jgi:hypothetical protein
MNADHSVSAEFDVSTGPCGGSPYVYHNNGLGQIYPNCISPGFNHPMPVLADNALDAANAWLNANGGGTTKTVLCTQNGINGLAVAATNNLNQSTAIWQYTGALFGYVSAPAPGGGVCPTSDSNTWG